MPANLDTAVILYFDASEKDGLTWQLPSLESTIKIIGYTWRFLEVLRAKKSCSFLTLDKELDLYIWSIIIYFAKKSDPIDDRRRC